MTNSSNQSQSNSPKKVEAMPTPTAPFSHRYDPMTVLTMFLQLLLVGLTFRQSRYVQDLWFLKLIWPRQQRSSQVTERTQKAEPPSFLSSYYSDHNSDPPKEGAGAEEVEVWGQFIDLSDPK